MHQPSEGGLFEGELQHPGSVGQELQTQRRFLVRDASMLHGRPHQEVIQAFFLADEGYALRVRRTRHHSGGGRYIDDLSTLTAMGPRVGSQRDKPSVPISHLLAMQLIQRAPFVSRKRRYSIEHEKFQWFVDEFLGLNSGLYIAEIDATPDQVATVKIPDWAELEILNRPELDNEVLARNPITGWVESRRLEVTALYDSDGNGIGRV